MPHDYKYYKKMSGYVLALCALLFQASHAQDEGKQDPCTVLPKYVFHKILSFADLQTFGRSMQVSKKWKETIEKSESLLRGINPAIVHEKFNRRYGYYYNVPQEEQWGLNLKHSTCLNVFFLKAFLKLNEYQWGSYTHNVFLNAMHESIQYSRLDSFSALVDSYFQIFTRSIISTQETSFAPAIQDKKWLHALSNEDNKNQEVQVIKKDPASELPKVIFKRILTFTDLQTLGRSMQVCKKWKETMEDKKTIDVFCDVTMRTSDSIIENYKQEYQIDQDVDSVECLRASAENNAFFLKKLLEMRKHSKLEPYTEMDLQQALSSSIIKCNFDAFSLLLDFGAPVHLLSNNPYCSPLLTATMVSHKDPRFIEVLLDKNARPDVVENTTYSDYQGITPLHSAAKSGKLYALSLFLQQPEVNINCHKKNSTKTPLQEAIEYGNYDVVSMLVDAGADFTGMFAENLFDKSAFYVSMFIRTGNLLKNFKGEDEKSLLIKRKMQIKLWLIYDAILEIMPPNLILKFAPSF